MALNYDLLHNWLDKGAFFRASENEFYIYTFGFPEQDFVTCEFFAKQFQLHQTRVQKLNKAELESLMAPLLASEPWVEPDILADKELFAKDLHNIQNKIHRGEITKAVPLIASLWKKTPSLQTRAQWLRQLLNAPVSLIPFGYWNQTEGILGASPEILFSLEGKSLRTMALAGTLPKSAAVSGDLLLSDEKELSEHRYVVEDLQKRLALYGKLHIEKTRVVELPTLYHLRTDFELHIDQKYHPSHWVSLLHPTPALGVSPREYGVSWMQEEMPVQKTRKFYGAPLYFPKENSEGVAIVAIRAIEWHSERTYLYAGCGIVKESQLDKEWAELCAKQDSVLKILGIK